MRSASIIRLRSAAFAAAALIAAAAAVPLSASAHFQPGGLQSLRWFWMNQPTGTRHTLRVLYDRDCIADPENADASAAAWQATATPLILTAVASGDCVTNHYSSTRAVGNGFQQGTIAIRSAYLAGGNPAWTVRGHCYWKLATDLCMGWSATGYQAGSLTYNDGIDTVLIYENHLGGYDALTASERQDMLKHEMGHAFGLEHAGKYAGEQIGSYSIMDFCCPSRNGLNFPSSHDVLDINMNYPGW